MALVPAVAVEVVVPPGVVTTIVWLPDLVVVGMVQVIEVALFTVKLVQAVPPTVTAVALVKLVPVIATVRVVRAVPMAALGHSPLDLTVWLAVTPAPVAVTTSVMVGAGARYVNPSLSVPLVPLLLDTVTSTIPAQSV